MLELPLVYKFFLAERNIADMVGIYKFTNRITGQSYVGRSVNIEERYKDHKRRADPNKPSFENTYFHRVMAEYGFGAYDFEILEECPEELLREREQYYIKELGTRYPNGYNIEIGGSHAKFPLKVTQYEVYGIQQDLKDGILSLNEIGQKYGISYSEVYLINNGKHWHSEYETYPLRKLYLGSTRKKPREVCEICGKPITEYCGCKVCRACFFERRRRFTPSKEELANMLRQNRPTELAQKLSVCRNTILNWRKKYGLDSQGNDIANS